jgi:VCBS repeat-containing protein
VPEVSSVERRTSHVDGATNANTLTWRVTFSEAVSGVGAGDFQLSGVTGATLQVVEVAGSNGTQYDVTASGEALVSHDGLVTLSFATDYTVQDLVGNAQASTAVAGTNDAAYALDNTAPVEPTLTTSLTNDATPVLRGTAEAGSVVEVTVGGAIFRITADASGEWLLDTSDTRLIVDGSFALGLDGAKAVTLRSTDAVGNSRAGSGEVVLDTTAPTAPTVLLSEDTGVSSSDWLTRASALGLSGRADADTTVTVDWGDGFAAILAERDGTGWSIGTWALSEGTHTVTVTATDAAGNSSQTVRTLVVDTTGPTVTPGAIRVSGATGTNGTFRIGDTVVATWDDSASGDHNSEPVVGVTMNFAWFGGFEEVQATLSDGVWTARYTIVAGDSDWNGARVDVSAMDSAGNVAWAADEALVAVDNEAPVIFSSWPTLSGATGSNGVFKIGDVVTVSWLPPVPGYTDYDLVDGMRVDFASFGGGQVAASFADGVWTARYTIVAGTIESSNCLVSLIVTDDAGNEARSDFEFDRIVDNTRPVPVLPSLSVAENAPDNGFVGDLAQPGTTHYELPDDAGGRFTLDPDLGTLYVTSGAWLDHEQADAHTITVRMTDTVGNTADVQVRIAVLDVNEAPTAQDDQAQALEAGGDANATHGLDPRGNVLDNDSDPDDGDALRVMAVRAGDGGLEPSAVTPHSTWEMNGTTIAGRYGTLVMGADGSYVYHVDNTNAAVQAAQLGGEPLTDEFSYVLTDAAGLTSHATLTLTVRGANDAPSQESLMDEQAAIQDSPFSFTVPAEVFADVDAGDSQSWSATLADGSALPSWLRFDADAHTFTGTPANGDVGALQVRVTVRDAAGAAAHGDFTLRVDNVNDAPTPAQALADQTATEDAAFRFTVPADPSADVDAGDTRTWSATLADGSELPSWLSFDADTHTFTGTPANGDVGELQVRVTVRDAAGAAADGDFTLRVANANDAPTLEVVMGDQAATEDGAFSFTVPAETFADMDAGERFTWSATLLDGSALPAWLSFDAATRTFTGTPPNGAAEALQLRVTVRDVAGTQAHGDFTLRVTSVNDVPTLQNAIADQAATEDGAFGFTVPAETFADVDAGDTQLWSATLVDGSALPSWLHFDVDTHTFTGTPANGDVGELQVRVTVRDAAGAAVHGDFTLRVSNVNDTPTPAQVLAGQTATEDAAFRFAVPAETFADVDADDTRTWSATLADGSALPSWLRFDPVTHTFTGTPADGDVGELQVRVTVRDAAGAAAHGDFTLRVANVNDAPTGGVTIAGSVAIGQVVRASSTVADADGMGPVTYRWLSSLDGQSWTVIEGATGDSLTIGSGLAGRLLRVELIYTDGHGTTEVVSSTPSDRVPPVPPPPVQPPSAPVLPPVPPSLTFPPAPAPASRDTGPSFLPPGSSLGNPNVDTLTRGDASVTTSNGNSGSNQQQQGNQPVLTDGSTPKLTQTGDSSSFRVVVLPSAAAAGAEGLVLNRGVADQVVAPSNGTAQITIPADAFAHTDPNAVVKLNARQANGEALPPWLSFDAATGKFTVRAAPGERRTIEVRVEARDGSNRTVFTTFKIQVGGPTKRTTQLEPAGRPGLSTQLRMAAERQQVPLGRLDQLARLAKRPAAELVKG